MMAFVSGVLEVVGAAFVLIGGIGVIRFGDFLSRTHPATKAPTLGLILIVTGVAIELHTAVAIITVVLVVVLQLLTVPVGTHMLGRASHGSDDVEIVVDEVDELARDKQRWLAAHEAAGGGTGGRPPGTAG
jgi:multicomponent Na+:H+ antiporter subunit G